VREFTGKLGAWRETAWKCEILGMTDLCERIGLKGGGMKSSLKRAKCGGRRDCAFQKGVARKRGKKNGGRSGRR